MRLSRILYVISAIFLVLVIAEFIGNNYSLRIAGQNLLNIRVWLFLLVVTTVIIKPDILLLTSVKWLIIYFIIYIMMEMIGHYDLYDLGRSTRFGWLRNQHFAITAAIIFSELAFVEKYKGMINSLVKICLVSILLICMISIIIIARNPGVVRGTEYSLYTDEIQRFRALGLGGYNFFSSLPFLIPVIVYKVKNRINFSGSSAFVGVLLLIILLITSYMAVIVAPFLLSIVILLLAVLGRRRIKANLALLLILLAIYIVTPKSWIGNLFYAASNAVENREISTKLSEIGYGFSEGFELVNYEDEAVTGVEGRASRILYNLKNFSKSPFIGTGRQANAHLYWLNLLAQFGLIGVIPLVFILVALFRKNLASMRPESWFTYYLTIGAFIALGLMKAMGGYLTFIIPAFLVPAMIRQEEEWLIRHKLL